MGFITTTSVCQFGLCGDTTLVTHNFIINYTKNSGYFIVIGYPVVVDFDYPEYLQSLHKTLSFVSEK